MRRFPVLFLLIAISFVAKAQDAKEMHANARLFMQQGDHANAVLVLNRAAAMEPANSAVQKDLALSYYFLNDQPKALAAIKVVLESDVADDQSYIIAGNIYKSLSEPKEAEKLYKKGIKKFPSSGAIYNELGEMMWSKQNTDAIMQWEKGIENDPSYSRNYYNAARYYYLTQNWLWCVLYGEIFVNMEPGNLATPEVKDILLDSYKKLFLESSLTPKAKENNKFIKAFYETMNKQSNVAALGINTETLTMIRTRFILDWYNDEGNPKFKLFEHHRQLLQEGLFDAYNQWLFGSSHNLAGFQNWINAHKDEYKAFTTFQSGRMFKIPAGEYYNK